jgi:hypothetical protein
MRIANQLLFVAIILLISVPGADAASGLGGDTVTPGAGGPPTYSIYSKD